MKYIYIDKRNGHIKMESDKLMDLPQFEAVKVSNKEKLDGYASYYRDGEIIREAIGDTRKIEIKAEVEKATTIEEIKEILNKLI